jgi:hypothetical protein
VAKKMSYTDPETGAVFPESVWLPLGVYIDFARGSGKVVFNGYVSPAVAAAALGYFLGLTNVPAKAPVGQKEYVLGHQELLAFATHPPTGATHLDTDSAASYELAAARLDTPAPTAGDPSRMVSFFDQAADLNLGP